MNITGNFSASGATQPIATFVALKKVGKVDLQISRVVDPRSGTNTAPVAIEVVESALDGTTGLVTIASSKSIAVGGTETFSFVSTKPLVTVRTTAANVGSDLVRINMMLNGLSVAGAQLDLLAKNTAVGFTGGVTYPTA